MGNFSPLSHSESSTNVTVEGYTPREDEDSDSDTNTIGAGFFQTLGTPAPCGPRIHCGGSRRGAKGRYRESGLRKAFSRGRNAIGKRMKVGAGSDPLNLDIVGVVERRR